MLLPLLAATAPCQDPIGPTPPTAQQAPQPKPDLAPVRAWLAAKGFAPTPDRPFVLVGPKDRTKGTPEPAFLLASDDDTIRYLTLEVEPRTGPAVDLEVTKASLSDHVKGLLGRLERDAQAAAFEPAASPHAQPLTRLLMLACASAENGDNDHAQRLLAVCTRMADHTKPLATQMADDLGAVAIWRLILRFDDPSLSWDALRQGAAEVVAAHSSSRFASLARNMEAVLTRMVREAAEPAAPTATSDEARIAELIHRLREQNGKQTTHPGTCMVFADPRGEDSPAAQLAKFGMQAIPQLVAVLDDDTLTHSIECHREFYFSHRVLTVGAIARAVFERITDHAPINRADGEHWLQTYQQQGETAVLVDGTLRGSGPEARRLVLRDPQVALAVLPEALAGLPPGRQLPLIAVLSGIADDQALPILREYLAPHNQPYVVPYAAAGLMVRGKVDEAVDGLITAFERMQDRKWAQTLAQNVLATGKRRGLAAIAGRLDLLDAELLHALANGVAWSTSALAPDGSGSYVTWSPERIEPGFDEDLENLLGKLVDMDQLRAEGAARALATRWPQVYAFDDTAPATARAEQLLAVRNVWRSRHGKGVLPTGGH